MTNINKLANLLSVVLVILSISLISILAVLALSGTRFSIIEYALIAGSAVGFAVSSIIIALLNSISVAIYHNTHKKL